MLAMVLFRIMTGTIWNLRHDGYELGRLLAWFVIGLDLDSHFACGFVVLLGLWRLIWIRCL